jgi:hypothetical protein
MMRWRVSGLFTVALLCGALIVLSGCSNPLSTTTYVPSPRPILPTIKRPEMKLPQPLTTDNPDIIKFCKEIKPDDVIVFIDSLDKARSTIETYEMVVNKYNEKSKAINREIITKLGLSQESLEALLQSSQDPVPPPPNK